MGLRVISLPSAPQVEMKAGDSFTLYNWEGDIYFEGEYFRVKILIPGSIRISFQFYSPYGSNGGSGTILKNGSPIGVQYGAPSENVIYTQDFDCVAGDVFSARGVNNSLCTVKLYRIRVSLDGLIKTGV
jgi:hypothetical protein